MHSVTMKFEVNHTCLLY